MCSKALQEVGVLYLIFPGDASALRLMGALLAETNERWQERRYLNMDEFYEWAAERAVAAQGNNVVALGEHKPKD